MDQQTLLKIAQFRTLAARKGRPFDVVRFASDRAFAKQTLTELLNGGDEELLVAGLTLMDLLGFTAAPAPGPAPAPAAKPAPPPPAPEQKYVGRLR